jgi:hypothetical protein
MKEINNSQAPRKSAKGDWWGGFTFLAFGLFLILPALRGIAWVPYKRYGAAEPLAVWQMIGAGGILAAMGVWQLTRAVKTTKMNRMNQKTQNQQIHGTAYRRP